MLVLTRKLGEKIHIGDDTVVSVIKIEGGCVRLGIEAPREVPILRDDVRRGEASEGKRPSRDELEERLQKAEALACKRAKSLDERDREIERLMRGRDEALKLGCFRATCEGCGRHASSAFKIGADWTCISCLAAQNRTLRTEIERKDAALRCGARLLEIISEQLQLAKTFGDFGEVILLGENLGVKFQRLSDEAGEILAGMEAALSPAEEGKEAR